MALLNRDEKNSAQTDTIIGRNVQVDGNFNGEGNVTVEGSVSGTLKTAKDLQVGPAAKIKADVEADNIHIAGEIQGNVIARGKLQLAATGKIIGNVKTTSLSVESGAILHGKCTMVDGKERSAELLGTEQDKSNK